MLRLQARMRGGLLGANHSWVAGPSDAAAIASADAAATAPAAPPAAADAAPAEPQPSLLSRASDKIYNWKEDALDALSEDRQITVASGMTVRVNRGVLLGGAAAAALLLQAGVLMALHLWRLQRMLGPQ